jgi:CheY-like chemotaxis protein
MELNHRTVLAAIAFAATLTTATALRAQDEKAAADQPAAEKAPAKAAPEKKAGPAGAKAAAAAEAAAAAHPPNPAVDTIIESKPTTPRELVQAAVSLAALDRADLAKQYLDQLLIGKPNAATLADLARQIGSGPLLQMAGDKSLNPQAQQVAEQVLAAAAAERRDPARLAAFVKQLGDPSPDLRRDAVVALRDAGARAVPLLLTALADPAQSKISPLAREALVGIGPAAVPPLVAALAAPDAPQQVTAIELLGEIGPPESAVPYLLVPYLSTKSSPAARRAAEESLRQLVGTLPTKAEAVVLLYRETGAYLEHERPLRGDESENVAIWHRDPAAKQLVVAEYPPRRAAAFVAARLAGDLFELDPDAGTHRRLYLISLLESAVYRAGLDSPLPTGLGTEYERAARLGVDAINDALAQALTTGHTAAAKGAAQILGDIGDVRLLTRDGANPSPLVQALRSSDRQLRVAAVEAIMKLKPNTPFPGSSYLTDALADMAAATGRHRVAIAFPTLPPLQELAGMTNALGFESVTATNGRQLVAAATESPDTELILVSGRMNRPATFELVQELLRDPRTGDVPICVMAELDERDLDRQVYEKFPRVFIETRPPSLDAMKPIVARGAEIAGDRFVPVKLRQQQAVQALDWLAGLAMLPPDVADVRRYEPVIERALYSPLTAPHAAAIMAHLATPSSQRSLIDLASFATQPLTVRQAAGAAFRDSVRKFGLRLSPSEILRQYERYNQSAQQDKDTQQLLGAVLDVIEKKGLGTGG